MFSMKSIESLLDIIDTLLGPEGCPWDQKQTLKTIKADLLEETCETIDAIESGEKEDIREELGDVLFVVLFLIRLAEKQKVSNLEEILQGICDKLIRRHPHIFGERKNLSDKELHEQWEAIKKKEKIRHPLEKIPKALPALSKGSEILKAAHKHQWKKKAMEISDPEMQIGHDLFALVEKAVDQKIDPELALRKYLSKYSDHLLLHDSF